MATIRPFKALRPTGKHIEPSLMKYRLEPKGDRATGSGYTDCREFLQELISAGRYQLEELPAVYIYRFEPRQGTSAVGIWALTCAQDFARGKILPHEGVIDGVVAQIQGYRQQVGLEGSAVLIGYPSDPNLSRLIQLETTALPAKNYRCEDGWHSIWTVSDPERIECLQRAIAQLQCCYLADGHHRTSAAVGLSGEQWVASLYVEMAQLEFSAFHRLIESEGIDRTKLTAVICQNYYMSYIPNNRPYRPDRKGRLGLFLSGIWYQLDPRPGMASLLQEADVMALHRQILSHVLEGDGADTDYRLRYYDDGAAWTVLLAELAKDKMLIAFTLWPMSAEELMRCTDLKMGFPVKSSCISPKAPYGLLIHDMMSEEREEGS